MVYSLCKPQIIFRLNPFCIKRLLSASVENSLETKNVSDTKEKKDSKEELVKAKILESSLKYVHEHSWSRKALTAGAESMGYPGEMHGMFPKGGIEIVEYLYKISNNSLTKSLEEKYINLTDHEPRHVIAEAVEDRLRMIIPYIDKWPEALALMTLPPNIPTALANLLTLVDDICYYAGDKSVDIKWYARRVALAGIYKTTELYMIQDKSPDYVKTWQFLDRRIDEALHIQRYLQQTEQASIFAKDIASATFTTARNILGLSWNR